jgi:hypothetical protein
MDSFVTDTQALVKFMMGKKVINERSHQAYRLADKGENTIIIPAVVLMEVLYLFDCLCFPFFLCLSTSVKLPALKGRYLSSAG